jgi:hypothetical protein
VMIAITMTKQSITSCTMMLAPKAPVPSLMTALTQSLMAHCRDPGLHPLPCPWRTTTFMTKGEQALVNSREPTPMMKITIFPTQFSMMTAFMLPSLLWQARSPRKQGARLRRMGLCFYGLKRSHSLKWPQIYSAFV